MEQLGNKIKKFFKSLGPGFVTGASDDDPTAIAAYTQAGARFGYGMLWTALFTFPFMVVIQEMCGRIGMVTGKGLSGAIRMHYPKQVLYFAVILLLICNTITIGADLGAMAASGQMLLNIPFIFWLIGITVFTLIMEVFVSFEVYSRFLKYIAFLLVSYIVVALIATPDWSKVLVDAFEPTLSLDKFFILNIVAILGTNISPYLFFWQAGEEVEQEVSKHKIRAMGMGVPKVTNRDLRELRLDTTVGMIFTNLVVFFICVTAASTLGLSGITDIETPAEAAMALKPLAGEFSAILFGLGIIASGLLAVPALAGSASYALSETIGWKEGLYRKFNRAHGFYGVITIATLIGLLVNFTPIKPFQMLVYSAALNGLLAPPLLICILLICNNKKIMGDYTNKLSSNFFGILITIIMSFASLALLYDLIF